MNQVINGFPHNENGNEEAYICFIPEIPLHNSHLCN